MVALPAGEALARDFLKLEARKSELEEQRWRFVEEMQNRHTVQEQRRVASLSVLDRRLRTEEKQHCLLKERNSIIRQQAAALCNPRTTEVQQRIRTFRERFALDAERQSMDWNRHIETQIREEIAHCRRDAQHCRQRQGEAMEVAMQQERLMVELAEAQGQAQEERAKLQEDVKVQQDRLRQRLSEQRQLMDDRVKALASGNLPGTAYQTLKPQEINDSDRIAMLPQLPGAERERTALPKMMPVQADSGANLEVGQSTSRPREGVNPKGFTGYVPKEGTRQAEVYRQLLRNEAEMAADLRLMEDRLVSRCSQCGFVGSPPGPADGRCDCGHFIEVLRVPPKIAQGKILQSGKLPTPNSTVSSKVFNTRPAAPAFAVRDPRERSSGVVTQPGAGQRLLSRLDPMEAAQEVAQRSLERLAARRQEFAASVQTEVAHVDSSSRVEYEETSKILESETAGLDVIPGTAVSPEATSGDLGILDVPVALQMSAIQSSQPRTMSGNDWYDGGSSTPTPRIEPEKVQVIQAETSSEDIAFEDHKDPTEVSLTEVSLTPSKPQVFSPPVATVAVALPPKTETDTAKPPEHSRPKFEHSNGGPVVQPNQTGNGGPVVQLNQTGNGGPVVQPNQTGPCPGSCPVPSKAEVQAATEAVTEEALQEPEEGEPMMEAPRPLQNNSTPFQREEVAIVESGSQLEQPDERETFAQVSSPDGSFTFGGITSPPEDLGDTNRALLQPVSEKPSSAEKSQLKTEASEALKESLAKESKLMSDLGLEDGSEDEIKVNEDRPPASSSLGKVPKRSNPLRGRGAGIMQGDSFIGPGGLGISGQGAFTAQGVSNLSKLKAKPKLPAQPSLFGGPIDWGQKENFR